MLLLVYYCIIHCIKLTLAYKSTQSLQETEPAQVKYFRVHEVIGNNIVESEEFIAEATLLGKEPEKGHDRLTDCYRHQKRLKQNVEVEQIVVPNAHAIVDPRAMMVKSLNAMPAN